MESSLLHKQDALQLRIQRATFLQGCSGNRLSVCGKQLSRKLTMLNILAGSRRRQLWARRFSKSLSMPGSVQHRRWYQTFTAAARVPRASPLVPVPAAPRASAAVQRV